VKEYEYKSLLKIYPETRWAALKSFLKEANCPDVAGR
jgi:hypothetical protein